MDVKAVGNFRIAVSCIIVCANPESATWTGPIESRISEQRISIKKFAHTDIPLELYDYHYLKWQE